MLLCSCVIECTCQKVGHKQSTTHPHHKAPLTPTTRHHSPPPQGTTHPHHKAPLTPTTRLPQIRTWKDPSEASIPTEMGPMLPTAILRAVSFLDGKVTQPVQVAPVVHLSSRHFSSCNNGSTSGHGQTSGHACKLSNIAHVGFVWVAIFGAHSL